MGAVGPKGPALEFGLGPHWLLGGPGGLALLSPFFSSLTEKKIEGKEKEGGLGKRI